MKKERRRWLWLGLGAVVIGLIFYNLSRSPEWRDFRWQRLWASLTGAQPGLLLLALVGVYSTYLIRAYRWRYFMHPIKRASLWILFGGQVLGFSSIFLIGRLGELVRPGYIAKKENVPMSAMLAVLALERVYDSVALILIFAASLSFEPVTPATARGEWVLHEGGYITFTLAGILLAGLVVLRLHAERVTAWALRRVHFLPPRALSEFEQFLHSFVEGLGLIRNWVGLLGSVASTLVLWGVNTTVFWLVFQSLRGGLERLPWVAAGLTLFCAALGLVVQFPGIGGGYQVGAILALSEIFNVAAEPATGAGILVWIMMSVPCLALGLVLLVREGLTFGKLGEMAEEERVTTLKEV
jgi:hypothetical protein